MATTYSSAQFISEFNGVVRGGTTIILHDPREIDAVYSFVTLAGPLFRSMYRSLTASPSDLTAWLTWQLQNERSALSSEGQLRSAKSETSEWEDLSLGLAAARLMWVNQAAPSELTLSITVSDTDPHRGDGFIDFDCKYPSLVLHAGSVQVSLIAGALRASGWVVALCAGRGLPSSKRAANLVEALRTSSSARHGVRRIERLDTMRDGELDKAPAVVILLHGLLSTDVGLFDSFINRLLQYRGGHADWSAVRFVGWPHDTLTSIEANAVELARQIRRVIRLNPPIAFVAHSRGGLVARATAVRLYRKRREKWHERLLGCVTFGTPHNGAALAELPEPFFGALVAGQALRGTGCYASLSDAIWYCSQRSAIKGIRDLRPLRAESNFLRTLIDSEEENAPAGRERRLDILAIGGEVVAHGNVWARLASRAFGDSHHDLIVEKSSSTPSDISLKSDTDCDHFSYFDPTEAAKTHFEDARMFLGRVLRLGAGSVAAAPVSPNSPGKTAEERFGGRFRFLEHEPGPPRGDKEQEK